MEKYNIEITQPPEYIPLLFVMYGREIGRLEFKGDKVVFRGDTDKAAKIFFEKSKKFMDKYLKESLIKLGANQ
ncbi:MAG TPA: hypothetical protein ENH85_06720 [Candidatus Scalindua sp.]|nr:hypothetical protein [Candidatus Scalindua sp.]